MYLFVPFLSFSFPLLPFLVCFLFPFLLLLFLSRTQFALPALRLFPSPSLRCVAVSLPPALPPLVRIVACFVTVTGASSVSSSRKGGISSNLLWSLHTTEQGDGTTHLVSHLQDCGGNTHAAWACTKKREEHP